MGQVLPIEQVNNKIHLTDSKMQLVRELNDALENKTGMLNKIIKIKMDRQRETKMRLNRGIKMLEIIETLHRSFPQRDKVSLRANRERGEAEAEPRIEMRRGKMRVTPGRERGIGTEKIVILKFLRSQIETKEVNCFPLDTKCHFRQAIVKTEKRQ